MAVPASSSSSSSGRWYDKIPFRSGLALHVFIWVTPGADQAARTHTRSVAQLSLSQ